MTSPLNSNKYLKKNLKILHRFFQKTEKKRQTPIHFIEQYDHDTKPQIEIG